MTRFSFVFFCLVLLAFQSYAQEFKSEALSRHSAKTVNADTTNVIPCTESLVRLLIVSAREAGNHQKWEAVDKQIKPQKFIAFETEEFGPYKAHLGSRGFTGIRSIIVEIEKPYRVMIEDAGEFYLTKLPEESDILHASRALWQTSMALQK